MGIRHSVHGAEKLVNVVLLKADISAANNQSQGGPHPDEDVSSNADEPVLDAIPVLEADAMNVRPLRDREAIRPPDRYGW